MPGCVTSYSPETQKSNAMKAMIIFIALFGIQISTVFGETSGEKANLTTREYTICVDCPSLLPVVPSIASYEDQKEVVILMQHEDLLPSVPMEADFGDPLSIVGPDVTTLMPRVPAEADFDDIP